MARLLNPTQNSQAVSERYIPPWEHVELSEDESYAALSEARRKKWEILEQERKHQHLVYVELQARKPWTAKELWQYIEHVALNELKLTWRDERGREHQGLQVDEFNKYTLQALCAYFAEDEALFKRIGKKHFNGEPGRFGSKWDMAKGIFLWGPVGTGKSTMLRLFRANKRLCFDMFDAIMLSDAYETNGQQVIKQFTNMQHNPMADIQHFFQRTRGLAIDDMGVEQKKRNHFGNEKNVLAEILVNRYASYQKDLLPRHYTHITSNLTPENIENDYGERLRDRFREMFNIITLFGTSRRY